MNVSQIVLRGSTAFNFFCALFFQSNCTFVVVSLLITGWEKQKKIGKKARLEDTQHFFEHFIKESIM